MILTPDELEQLTGRIRADAQARALRHMGIDHKLRPDGSVAVLRSHAERVLGGAPVQAKAARRTEPDFSMVR
jgi:hypothetical protein